MARRFPRSRLRDAAPLFAALGDPTRLGLVALLSAGGPASIADLSASVEVSRQAVTKHLQVLEGAGLVHGFRDGRQHIWELEPERLADAHEFLDRIGAEWDAALERLERFLDKN